jgi:AdoMet-dependent heme synthase
MRTFDDAPFLVIWEVTQACDLACLHCRASAAPCRSPRELDTAEGFHLLEEIKRFGDPLMVFTGGDPLKRPDLFDLLSYSAGLGLRTTVTPSATPLLTGDAVEAFQRCGVARMALSVDGATSEAHDAFRGVHGSFARSLAALEQARRIGLQTQINTTVNVRNRHTLPEIASLVAASGAALWSVFFLVPTGRAARQDDLDAAGYEETFRALYDLSAEAHFDIKTTEAQHYRRYLCERRKAEGPGKGRTSELRQAGINDGKGLVFVAHDGGIFPSGFLPVAAGNVRRDALGEVYRNAPLFRQLRDSSRLGGKCGRCQYRNLCGGSRSRAYAVTGDPMGEEPKCTYQPLAGCVLQ